MIQTLSPLASKSSEQSSAKVLCLYTNSSSQLRIAKINNIQNCKFERVVFPGERLLFEAVLDAKLEIYIGRMGQVILVETINCDRLRVDEESSVLVSKT
jgi:3-hydroxymyristoyl/3-hydroxydecanoyl-(acyl carrier protein) dehydratase